LTPDLLLHQDGVLAAAGMDTNRDLMLGAQIKRQARRLAARTLSVVQAPS
jgi:hypothetical protein